METRERIAKELSEKVSPWRWEHLSENAKVDLLSAADWIITRETALLEGLKKRMTEAVVNELIEKGYGATRAPATANGACLFVPLLAPEPLPVWCNEDCPYPWRRDVANNRWLRTAAPGVLESVNESSKVVCCEYCTAKKPEQAK